MKKKLFLKFFVLAVIGAFVTFTSCKDYDDDISRLDKELGDAKTELTGSIASQLEAVKTQLAAVKTELNTAIDGKVKAVADELAATKTALTESQAKLTALEAASATKEEVEAVKTQIAEQKAEILEKTVTLAAFNDFKADHAEDFDEMMSKIALTATKAEVDALEAKLAALEASGATKAEVDAVKAQLATLEASIDAAIKAEVAALEAKLAALEASGATKVEVEALEAKLAALKADAATKAEVDALEAKLAALEASGATKVEVEEVKAQLAALKADGATKAEVAALETKITGMLSELQASLDALDVRLTSLEKSHNELMAKHDEDLQNVIASIAGLKAELDPRISTIETLLDIAEGKSGVLNRIADDLAAHLTKIGANADAIALLRSDLEAELADQLVLINANKTAIEAVKDDLAAKYAELVKADADLLAQVGENYDELDGKISLNKDAIDALEIRIKAIEDELPVIKKSITDLGEALNMSIDAVYTSLDHRVYTLTFIPDFTSTDGTPQIVVRGLTEWKFYKPANNTHSDIWTVPGWNSNWDENWAVLKKGVIYKGITTLRYNVSPSNVQLTDFQVKQLVNKTSLVRAAGTVSAPIVLSGQATLANGVLSVPVVIEDNNYNSANFSSTNNPLTNVSVALQVENINVAMDNNKERIVTSTEYIKANFDLSHGRIALNEKSLKTNGTLLPVGFNDTDIAHANYASDIRLWNGKSQYGNMTDVLNHTINLNDYIYGAFDNNFNQWVKMNDNGFNAHTFKFRRVYLQNEGVNQTNDYVSLNETTGVIGVVPSNNGTTVNQGAVGRTPVVEVTALVNGKVHAVGYIKIHITDAFDKSDVNFEFTLEDYVLGCNSTHKLTDVDIAAIDFDQIFNHPRIQLGKDAFFNEYQQGGLTAAQVVNNSPVSINSVVNYPGSVPATVGITNASDVWFTWNINPQTQSVNLYNYLQGNINNNAPHGTYKVVTTLKSNGYRPDVVITWNFKVVLPTNLALTPNNVFLSNGVYKLQPTVYGQTPTPKTSTPYEGLLQNAFLHNNNNFNLGAVAGDQTCAKYLSPYFVFTKVPSGFHIVQNPQSPQTETGTFEVRQDVTNDLAATIYYYQIGDPNPLSFFSDKGFYIKLNDNTQGGTNSQVGNYKPYTQAAIDLVKAGWVEVQPRGYINGQPLNWVNLYDPFTIQITYPVKFNFADKYEVWDQGTGAKQQVTIRTIPSVSPLSNNVIIKDFLDNDIVFGTLATRTAGLINHYEIDYTNVGGITGWVPNVIFDVANVTTNLPNGILPFGMEIKVDASASTAGTHVYKWQNATGGSVQNAFEIYIPASIKHKWGVLEGTVTVVVNPGTGI